MSNVGVAGQTYKASTAPHDMAITWRDETAGTMKAEYYHGGAWRTMTDSGLGTLINRVKAVIGERVAIGLGRASVASPFPLDTRIDILSSGVLVEGMGMGPTRIRLNNGVNHDMIRINQGRYVNVRVANLCLDGNKANNPTGGDGVNALIASGAVPESMAWWIEIENVRVLNPKGQCFNMGMSTTPASPQCRINNIRGYGGDGTPQVYFKNMYDSLYTQLWASSMQWDGCTKSVIGDAYVGGGGSMIQIKGSQIQADRVIIDNIPNGVQALRLQGDENQIRTTVNNKQNTTAIEALYVIGDGNNIELQLSDDDKTSGSKWDYAVRESSASDVNYFKVINPHDLVTVGEAELRAGRGSRCDAVTPRPKVVNYI